LFCFSPGFCYQDAVFPFHTLAAGHYGNCLRLPPWAERVYGKDGVFGILRWVEPVCPYAGVGGRLGGDAVSTLCVVGMVYASYRLQQDDLEKIGGLFFHCAHGPDGPGHLVASGTGCRGNDPDVSHGTI